MRKKLVQSPIPGQILAIVTSIGVHYLLVNNLGLLAKLNPPPIRPLNGGVKVVELTPAEQTRVPAAVKANPLPIAPMPVNPAPATRNPPTFSNPIPFVPPSTVLPSPTVAPINPGKLSTNKTPDRVKPANEPDRVPPPNRFGINKKIKIDPFAAVPGDDTPTKPGSPPSTTTPGSGAPIAPGSPPTTTTPGSGTPTKPGTPPASLPGPRNNEETPGDDLNSAIQNSDSIMKKKRIVFGAGEILPGGDLGAQSYPDKNKFKISCANSSNGSAVLIFGVKPDDRSPSTLIISNVHTEFSNNIIKLDRSLKPQDFIGTILASDTFKQLLEQGEQKATNNYNGLNAEFKRKSPAVYYRFTTKFLACSSPP